MDRNKYKYSVFGQSQWFDAEGNPLSPAKHAEADALAKSMFEDTMIVLHETMLQRMAAAVEEEFRNREMHMVSRWDAGDWEALVRAAIEAMREPTETMIEAAVAPYRHNNTAEFDALFKKQIADYWRAMIDAALAEPS